MKALLYVIAIVVILAGGWFSYGAKGEFAKLKAQREELAEKNDTRKALTVDVKKKVNAMEKLRDEAKAKRAQAESDLEAAESHLRLTKKEAATWKNKIAGLDEETDKVQKLIDSVKNAFKELDGDIELDRIPFFIKKLENDRNVARRKLEELQALSSTAEKRVATNSAQIDGLTERVARRTKRIASNSAEGTVTAVNHDWGFAIVNIPGNMVVNEASKLTVKRGSAFIGRLKINAIEGRRIVTDVDYRSMAPGMVVKPGDHVILTKPVAN